MIELINQQTLAKYQTKNEDDVKAGEKQHWHAVYLNRAHRYREKLDLELKAEKLEKAQNEINGQRKIATWGYFKDAFVAACQIRQAQVRSIFFLLIYFFSSQNHPSPPRHSLELN